MRSANWTKILAILAALIFIFSSNVWASPIISAGNQAAEQPSSKISSLLALHIKLKQAQAAKTTQLTMQPFGVEPQSAGEPTFVNSERVFLHFLQPPKVDQIHDLTALGMTVYPDSWIPPVNSFDTGFLMADMPVDQLESLSAKNYILSLDTAEQTLSPQNDAAREAMNVTSAWNSGYTGTGVTVAVIDSGLDTSNTDFPAAVAAVDYSNYPTTDSTIANAVTGHGTHVTGSLLGRGTKSATYKGVAPGANLVFLKVGNDTDGSASSAAVAYAIRDAVDIYHARIINLSYGGWSQYHDGTDQICQAVDYATSQGATVFAAAGNVGSMDWHYSGQVGANSTTANIPVVVAPDTGSLLAMNLLWNSGNQYVDHALTMDYYDANNSLLNPFVATSVSARRTQSQLYQLNPSSPVGPGTYHFKITNSSTQSVNFHIYYMGGSPLVTFSSPDPNYTIDSPAEADSAVAVGAYVTRNTWTNYKGSPQTLAPPETVGAGSSFSSRGPRIDGVLKPDIVAPGSTIISTRDPLYIPGDTRYDPFIIDNDGQTLNGSGPANYYILEGTSMACPMAAGVGALILNKNPTFTPAQVKHALEVTASDKGAAGFDTRYGWGLINAGAAIEASTNLKTYSDALHNLPCRTFDESQQSTIYMSGSGYLKNQHYNVTFYDGYSHKVATNNVISGSTGVISSQHNFAPGTDAPGAWHIVVSDLRYPLDDSFNFAWVYSDNTYSFAVQNSDPCNLTVSTTGNGTVTPAAGSHTFDRGSLINISAKPAAGWRFTHWEGNVADQYSEETTIKLSTDQNLIANFVQSPDVNGKLVFSTCGGNPEIIYSINANGTNRTKLTNGFYGRSPSWSPNGTKIVFVSRYPDSEENLFVMNSDGSNLTQLTNNEYGLESHSPAWSPDGTKIAYINDFNGQQIMVMNADGSNPRQLTHNSSQWTDDNTWPTWSPDSSKIAFMSHRYLSDGIQLYEIDIINADGTGQQKLADRPDGSASLAWSPDGTKLAFFAYAPPTYSRGDVFIMDSNGSNIRKITNGEHVLSQKLAWSPDSTHIAFGYEPNFFENQQQIYAVSVADGRQTQLTYSSSGSFDPSWISGSTEAPSVSTSSATNLTAGSARLNGTVSDLGTTASNGVYFEWGMLPNSYPNKTKIQTRNSTGQYYFDLTNLIPGQSYHYRARAAGNGSAYGSDVTFTTMEISKIAFTTPVRVFAVGSASGIISVQTQDSSGNPVNVTSNLDVNLSSTSTTGKFDTNAAGPFNGTISKVTIPTGASSANFYYKDTKTGTPTITAAAAGLASATQQVTVTAGTAASLSLVTPPVKGASVDISFTTQPVVRVVDQFGNLVNGATVTAARGTGTGTLRGNNTAVSNASGLASFTDLGYSKAGEAFSINFTAGTGSVSVAMTALNAGAPTAISLNTAPVIGASVDALLATQPVVLVRDQYSNPISGKAVTVSLAAGSGTLRGTLTATSAATGLATFTNLGYSKSEENFSLRFAYGTLTVDSSSLGPLAAGAAKKIRVETEADGTGTIVPAQNLETGNSLTVYGVSRDQFDNYVGNPTSGTLWSLTSKTGTVADGDLVPAANGTSATLNATAPRTGSARIHAVNGAMTPGDSGVITITSVIHHLGITTQPAGTSVDAVLGNTVVVAYDAASNPINGVTITASLASGTGALRGTLSRVTSGGQATFSDLGYSKTEAFTIRFTANTQSIVSNAVGPLAAGVAKTLSFSIAPAIGASVDVNLVQPVVRIVDQFGNGIGGVTVTASRVSGTGTLRGTLTATTVATGLATFTDLGYNKAGEAFMLRFTGGTLSVNSASLGPLAAGAATQVRVETAATAAGQLVTARSLTIGSKLTVYSNTRDQYGNFKANVAADAWSLTGISGEVVAADLVVVTDYKSAVLTGHKAGKAVIHVEAGALTADSGQITVSAAAPPPVIGGGGLGGGMSSATLKPVGFSTDSVLSLGSDGVLGEAAQLQTTDGKVTLDIAAKTKLLSQAGNALSMLTLSPLASPPSAPEGNVLVLAYELGPEGATFDPALTLTLKYGTLPAGTDPASVKIAYWSGSAWVSLLGTVDTAAGTVSAKISHFSQYAILVSQLTPARFTLSDLTLSAAKVNPGDTLTVQTTVTNAGGKAGSYQVVLKLNGSGVETKEIALEAGKTQSVTFQIKAGQPGDYAVDVNGQTGKFAVAAPVVTTVPPTTTPPPVITQAPLPQNITDTPAPVTKAPITMTPPVKVNWLLWIGLAVGIVLLTLVSVVLVRRNSKKT